MRLDIDDQLLPKIVSTIRASSALGAQDVDFYRSLDRDVGDSLDATSAEMVDMINSILGSIDQHCETLDEGKEKLEDSWKDFSNLMDNLLEKSDRALDKLTKGPRSLRDGSNLQYLDESARRDITPTKRIAKPQLNFKTAVDNTETHPFVPLLNEKPYAIKPLSESLKLIPKEEDIPEHYLQPYEYEIDNQQYNESVILKAECIPSKSWDNTDAIWIDKVESLDSMITDLKKATAIAVDLEHHDYRSYYGIVCLMQISTRDTDYLIDTIALREDLRNLNEIFANPHILKVFHGAFMDIIWLQRDLGLYVVSLFDTYHASKAIGLPRHSLAYLLEKFANFKTSKKYQLADWRVRPLSKSMNAYARADTHFLLNIYDQLRNKLIEENKLAGVLFESRNVAKRRFEYSKFRPKFPSSSVYSPIEKVDVWRTLMYQYNIPPQKDELVKRLYEWRDMISRRDDESPRYVMSNQLLVALVDHAPVDPTGVVTVNNIVTDHVRTNSIVLASLIKSTLGTMEKLKKIESADHILANSSIGRKKETNLSNVLTVPQIDKMASQFKIVSKRFSQIKDKSCFEDAKSILFGNIFDLHESVIDYSHGQKRHVTSMELKDRSLGVIEKIRTFDDTALYSISVADLAETHERPIQNDRPNTSQAPLEKDEPEEDMDDIILLKKIKNREIGRNEKNTLNTSEKELVDYSKAQKILGKERSSNDSNPKKRKFDPYAASNHSAGAPQAAKKRRATTRGKNVSFKK